MTDLRTLQSPPSRNAPQADLDALVALHGQGRAAEARQQAALILARYPFCEVAHYLAGALAAAAGRPAEAIGLYDQALSIAPDYIEAFNNRGNALKALERFEEALASFDSAIALKPDYAEAHLNRAIVLRLDKRLDEALAANAAAIDHNPRLIQAYSNRGNVLQDLYRYAEALADYDMAIELAPHFAQAHVNRGNVLRHLKRLPEAIASYDQAIALAPADAMAHRNRGAVLKEMKRLAEALSSFEAALALDPSDTTALSEAAALDAQMCSWRGPDRADELQRRLAGGDTIPPFHLLAISDDPAVQQANAERWAKKHFPAQPAPAFAVPRTRGAKIRIGYFSADFHSHATMALMIGLLERHDRERFEIYAFSYGPEVEDAMRGRVRQAVDAFHDIGGLGDEAAAQLARDLGVDIAIDLKGYTHDGRPGIFACRAAPCQIAYLGYPGTTGADYIDYMIADRVTVPEADRAFYSERLLYLPHSYQVNDSAREIAETAFTRAGLGLPESGFVFASLNNSYKITAQEFGIWMRLLSRVEGSVLWLFADNPWVPANLRREAAARGVDPFRLIFMERLPMDQHLARQRHADLFLDTFNVNAHTTASDALWAGLPVVTRLGASFAARVAGSLLYAVDLPELVTDTAEAYESLTFDLATNPERMAGVTARLAANRKTTPLFDTERFTRDFEDLLAQAAERLFIKG